MSETSANHTNRESAGRRGKRCTLSAREARLEVRDLRNRVARADEAASRYEGMLREGDHRIKNSLQIVASLIEGQLRAEASETARRSLLSASARIRSISVIHDALQSGNAGGLIDLGSVLKTVCEGLQAMAGSEGRLEVIVQVESIDVPAALAQPLALAVTELVLNALRHGFPNRDAGLVRVNLSRTGNEISIEISDDGVGLPDDYGSGRGYGTKLVGMMMRQAGSALSVERRRGTVFTIRLPAPDIPVPLAGASPA